MTITTNLSIIVSALTSYPFSIVQSIVVAGNDSQVTFYDEDGGEENTFDHTDREECREFTAAATNPTGDSMVLGNFNSFYVYVIIDEFRRRDISTPWLRRAIDVSMDFGGNMSIPRMPRPELNGSCDRSCVAPPLPVTCDRCERSRLALLLPAVS